MVEGGREGEEEEEEAGRERGRKEEKRRMEWKELSCVYTTVLSLAERAQSTVVRVYTHNSNGGRAREEVGAG